MVCDEGSQLVKLLGQIRNTEKEDHIQNDEIIESLMDEKSKDYSNAFNSLIDSINNMSDENIYNLQVSDGKRKIKTLDNLEIKIGSLK
jgi:hypothetical protein